MGMIDYTNIENDAPATANLWNERFGQIVNEINGNIEGENIKDNSIPMSKLVDDVFERLYPIGSIYTNATDNTNPGSLLGFGSWAAFGSGRVMVGVDTEQTEFNAAGNTGGDKALQSHTHTGTTSTAGDHSHTVTLTGSNSDVVTNSRSIEWSDAIDSTSVSTSGAGSHNHTFTTASSGTGSSGNLQPFVVVYMWRRTG